MLISTKQFLEEREVRKKDHENDELCPIHDQWNCKCEDYFDSKELDYVGVHVGRGHRGC